MAGSGNGHNLVSTLLSKEEKDLVFSIIGDGNEVAMSSVTQVILKSHAP